MPLFKIKGLPLKDRKLVIRDNKLSRIKKDGIPNFDNILEPDGNKYQSLVSVKRKINVLKISVPDSDKFRQIKRKLKKGQREKL